MESFSQFTVQWEKNSKIYVYITKAKEEGSKKTGPKM